MFGRLLRAPSRFEPVAYAALRIWFALTILPHGYPKLLHLPHGGSADDFANLVQVIGGKLHLPLAGPFAMLVTLVETLGALMLAAGLATRLAAAAIAVDVLVAAFGVHLPKWEWTAGGAEYPLLMAALAIYMAVRGGGGWSLDSRTGAASDRASSRPIR